MQSLLLQGLKNTSTTENGAVTNASSLDAVLDLFATAGAARKKDETAIRTLIEKAAKQDLALTLKCLFWARDVLQGAGERRFFRIAYMHLVNLYGTRLKPTVKHIPTLGRWDDLHMLLDGGVLETEALNTIAIGLLSNNGLAAKWTPRKGPVANKLRKHLGFDTPGEFRRFLVERTRVVEQQMSGRKWDEIAFRGVPSRAMQIYRKAFQKHTPERFKEYVEALTKGTEKVNAKAVYPYQIIKNALSTSNDAEQIALMDAQWNSLPNFLDGDIHRILPLCDVSGSMSGSSNPSPLEVCISLGIYVAERNTGIFKNHFLTFSAQPKLVELKGNNIAEKAKNLDNSDWGYNTNIQAAFDTILDTARRYKVPQDEMPEVLLVMSDMEFDSADSGHTNFQAVQKKYAAAGYTMPRLIFWNLQSRGDSNFPVVKSDENAAMISGFSPSILRPILRGQAPTPLDAMLQVIDSDRYKEIYPL